MTRQLKATNEEIIAAYRETGSVWRAAKGLGMAGQTVHERLKALGYPLVSRTWTQDETDELRALVGHMTIGQLAHQLGRPYSGVAGKISELGIGTRFGNRVKVKVPRGAGYDKASCAKYVKQIDASGDLVSRFARRNGLGVENLCRALEVHFPEWWVEYRRSHSDLAEIQCPYCGRSFIPSNAKQTYCTRKCAADRRADLAYFGGRRREAIGMAQEQCQLCGKEGARGLTPHHVIGKENDPEDAVLLALCPGCHQLVTLLGGRKFLDEPEGWESLIQLAYLRRNGAREDLGGVRVYVDIEAMTKDEAAEELADEQEVLAS